MYKGGSDNWRYMSSLIWESYEKPRRCNISGEAAGDIWNWSLLVVKGLYAKQSRRYSVEMEGGNETTILYTLLNMWILILFHVVIVFHISMWILSGNFIIWPHLDVLWLTLKRHFWEGQVFCTKTGSRSRLSFIALCYITTLMDIQNPERGSSYANLFWLTYSDLFALCSSHRYLYGMETNTTLFWCLFYHLIELVDVRRLQNVLTFLKRILILTFLIWGLALLTLVVFPREVWHCFASFCENLFQVICMLVPVTRLVVAWDICACFLRYRYNLASLYGLYFLWLYFLYFTPLVYLHYHSRAT